MAISEIDWELALKKIILRIRLIEESLKFIYLFIFFLKLNLTKSWARRPLLLFIVLGKLPRSHHTTIVEDISIIWLLQYLQFMLWCHPSLYSCVRTRSHRIKVCLLTYSSWQWKSEILSAARAFVDWSVRSLGFGHRLMIKGPTDTPLVLNKNCLAL